MLGLATLCCHSVSETFRWTTEEAEKDKERGVPRQRTEEGQKKVR